MITLAQNPVKLIKRSGDRDVRLLIWHTNQTLTVPIAGLEEESTGEIDDAMAALDAEAEEFREWLKRS
jgi:hypothetical protein